MSPPLSGTHATLSRGRTRRPRRAAGVRPHQWNATTGAGITFGRAGVEDNSEQRTPPAPRRQPDGSGNSMNTDKEYRGHGEEARGRSASDDAAAVRAARFGELPARVSPDLLVEEKPAEAPHDPNFGRNPETDWMIRYSA
jgi:hypothetical protein